MNNKRIKSLDIIIINWNAGKQLYECVESIKSAKKDNIKLNVVIVDNASTDDSLSNISNVEIPNTMNLKIIKNSNNKGFAKACNQGAKGSQADYLLFLNPDTKLFENSLTVPIAFMEKPENKKVGIAGIQLVDDLGDVARTCARFPTPSRFFIKMLGLDKLFPKYFLSHFMREWDHSESRIVDQVMGAFFLVRRSLFESLGGFDERFFVYFEEVDFSYKAYKAGRESVYLGTAQAYHAGGGISGQIKAKRLFYSLRSRILYSYKHSGPFSATLLMLGTIFIEPFSRLALAGSHCSIQEVGQTVQTYGLLFRALPSILKSAWQGEVRVKK